MNYKEKIEFRALNILLIATQLNIIGKVIVKA